MKIFRRENDKRRNRQKDYAPTMWNEYFNESKVVETDRGVFRVYLSKQPEQTGPVLVLLHGGGYSALTWSHFTVIICHLRIFIVVLISTFRQR